MELSKLIPQKMDFINRSDKTHTDMHKHLSSTMEHACTHVHQYKVQGQRVVGFRNYMHVSVDAEYSCVSMEVQVCVNVGTGV